MIFKTNMLTLIISIFQAASVQAWISRGALPSKLVLGLPAYGRTFTLSDSSNINLGDATSDGGTAGTSTQTKGFLGYNEVCVHGFLKSIQLTRH